MINNQFAQGDVLLTPVDALPEGAVKQKSRTVAEGEATGHHHTFTEEAEVYTLNGKMWVVAEEGAVLNHQEHDPIVASNTAIEGMKVVTPGIYEVDLQVESDPFAGIRRVQD